MMNDVFTWFYLFMSVIMILAYLPQIYAFYVGENEVAVSAKAAWFLWWVGSIASTLYSNAVLHDKFFGGVSFGHFIGTTIIVLLLMRAKPSK